MIKYVAPFHYLTQDLQERTHAQQAELACKAGANWIQYRCFTKSDEELIDEINNIAVICDDWGATLIITDHFHLLARVDVQGVHIENMKADLAAIRQQIGDDKTLGASANSFDDVQNIVSTGAADYIGCGPFSTTLTKINDYPLLGVKGYRDLMSQLSDSGISIPLLAIGGIQVNDVKELLETGVYGIAVSAAVNMAVDPAAAIKEFRSCFI
ncbi:MAG TPA: thiamine phosphate synthase [Sphingobacteriaceae bacterium]|nr:thiamine phosphate synthase [Sphingobacteriaceae bacterium]